MATVSSNTIIESGSFMAWERWNPAALSGDAAPHNAAASEVAIDPRDYADGFEEGRIAGFAAGRESGCEEGRKAGLAEVARLCEIADAATEAMHALGNTISHRTVALAVSIAQKLVQSTFESDAGRIGDVVRDALNLLPDTVDRARLVVNAADLELVRGFLADNPNLPACKLVSAPEVRKGGCHITSPCGDVDATLESRWNRVMETLGVSHEPPCPR